MTLTGSEPAIDSSRPSSSLRSIASLGSLCSGLGFTSGLPPRFLVAGFAISFSLPNVWWDNGVAVAWFKAPKAGTIALGSYCPWGNLEAEMKALSGIAAVLIVLATVAAANAKGCIKGAAVGAVAGHYSGHHGLLGAAAGCVIGRHEANKRDRMPRNQLNQPDRDLRNGEERL